MAQMCMGLYEITFPAHESVAGPDSQSLVTKPLVCAPSDAQANSAQSPLVPRGQVLIVLNSLGSEAYLERY